MSEIFGVKRLKTIDDWIEVVTRRHYKQGHSAYECAHRWKNVGSRFPEPIASICRKSRLQVLEGMEIKQLYAEFPVWLDTHSTPSKNDLMIFAEGPGNRKVVVAVEAKCDESFAQPVDTWIRTADKPVPRRQRKLFKGAYGPVERKIRRLKFLNAILSTDIGAESTVRYQLLHRTASAVLTARQTYAEAAVVLIQAFTESEGNFRDFQDFCKLLGFPKIIKNTVIGPYFTAASPEVPLFLIYFQDRRQGTRPHDSLFPESSTTQAA
ncbi:DUF6946 family protein [Turneriella parva]|uniref:DUF6946 domain-containing protein n=1 Tax=Turneriella parva (strain ATCC BAA-1111 / DSM 21527 / NCTC 11395 / H) TaxID=869212 RepID=I4BA78_TURPD|nr:hypothetical protein [Turneriella parva]AFM14185.1 hypothetical protein Turpa_3550 [Turneriella parva DSM 21527]